MNVADNKPVLHILHSRTGSMAVETVDNFGLAFSVAPNFHSIHNPPPILFTEIVSIAPLTPPVFKLVGLSTRAHFPLFHRNRLLLLYPFINKSGVRSSSIPPQRSNPKPQTIKRRTDQIGTNPYCKFPHAGKPSGSFRAEVADARRFVAQTMKGLPGYTRNLRAAIAQAHLPANKIGNGKLQQNLVEALGYAGSTIEVNFMNVHVRENGVAIIKKREWLNALIEAVAESDEKQAKKPHGKPTETKAAKGETKPRPNGTANGHTPKPQKRSPPIPNGLIPSDVVKQLGYPEGTTITVSRKMGNAKNRAGNVDIKPPNHVAMLYSIGWLEEQLKAKKASWPGGDSALEGDGVDMAAVRQAEAEGKDLEAL